VVASRHIGPRWTVKEESMHDEIETIEGLGDLPTVKQRTAVHNAAGKLLDALAPEGPPPRGAAAPPQALRRTRSPRGCILQADAHALTVSWFPSTPIQSSLGELQVIVWRGTVSRPGSASREAGGAQPIHQVVLEPVEVAGTWGWRGEDGTVFDNVSLVDHCRKLIEQRM
jgi:hypothetical protein